MRLGPVRSGQFGGIYETKGAAEVALPFHQAQLEPQHDAGAEAPHGTTGQATLPQNNQRSAQLRRQVLLN